jgi:uncharacterized protein YbjQ (UPF0145 family)
LSISFSNLDASVRTIVGGEVAGYSKLLTDRRNRARELDRGGKLSGRRR